MKVRVESASPDGMKVYLEEPIFVMTWKELTPLLMIIDKLHYTKDLSNLRLRAVDMTDESWEHLWSYILERGQADDDFCDVKCGWVESLTQWRKDWEKVQSSEGKTNESI